MMAYLTRPATSDRVQLADGTQQGFQKGNTYGLQNTGTFRTDEKKLNDLRKLLTNLDEGTTLNVNQLHKSTGISRKTIDNIITKEYADKFNIPGMGKAQSLNIQKLNKAKQEKTLEEFNKIKKSYSKDLIEKYKFPSGSSKAKKFSNAELAKKYFGKVNVATIARVERLNSKLAKELNLSYPKADPSASSLTRIKKAEVGKKYASEAELERFKIVEKQKKKLNSFFKNKPNAINNTEFGKEIKKLMNVRIDEDGNFFQKTRTNDYYIEKAKKGQIFDIFDINKIEKGQRMTKFTSNLNITPSQFNQGFIEGQVDRYFKPGGRLEGQSDKLKNIDEYLKNIGVKVDIEGIGRIGGGEKVFYETATGKFPHIYNTMKNMKVPDTLLTDINPTINIKGVTTADKIDRPDFAKEKTMFDDFGSRTSANPFFDPQVLKQGALDTLKVLGTPTVAAGFAGSTIKKNLDEGQNFLDAATDKMVGVDLLYPEVAKQTVGRFAKPTGKGILSTLGRVAMNPFGRAARAFTPVGAGITAIGLGKDYYDFAKDEIAKVKEMSPEERNFYNDLLMDEGGLLD
jgi:hypothetical protein